MDKKIAEKYKNILNKKMSYTTQTYEEILREFISITKSGDLPVQWDNLTETDPIMMLMNLMAAHKDILNYQMDYRLLEAYATTAKEKASLIRIANSEGYKIPNYVAARAEYKVNKLHSEVAFLEPFTTYKDKNGVNWTYVGPQKTIKSQTTVNLYQGSADEMTFFAEEINKDTKTISINAHNIAFNNSYNNEPVVSLSYGNTKYDYVSASSLQTASQNVFELNIDTTNTPYIQFPPNFTRDDKLGTGIMFTLKFIRTNGLTNISPADIEASSLNLNLKFTYEEDTYYPGKNNPTDEEIREGILAYVESGSSLVTVRDYYNFIMYKQRSVPEITKCFVVDKQTDSLGLGGDSKIPNLDVNIYATILNKDNEHKSITDLDLDGILRDELMLYKGIGVKLNIKETTAHLASINIDTGDIELEEAIEAEIKDILKEYLKTVGIRELVTINDLRSVITENDYDKYFTKGYSISINDELSYQLGIGEYIEDCTVNFNGE